MAGKRVVRGAGVKAKVTLAAVGGASPGQIASRFGVHPTQVASWKKRLVEGAEELFADKRRKPGAGIAEQELYQQQELYEQIGRLQMKLAWLKKNGQTSGDKSGHENLEFSRWAWFNIGLCLPVAGIAAGRDFRWPARSISLRGRHSPAMPRRGGRCTTP